MQTSKPSIRQRVAQPKILVVEDNEDNLVYITYALALFKYHYLVTQNAHEGLFLAQEYQPDLIILDIKMPQISGIDLIKMLRSQDKLSQTPVVAVTALATESEKELIFNAGFNGYLVKPYFLDDLKQTICSCI